MTKLDAPSGSGENDAKKAGPKGKAWNGDDALKITAITSVREASHLGSRPTCTADRRASLQRWRF